MSQVTDRTVGANPTGFDMRTELNNIIGALESDNSGSSEPLNPVAYMKWLDTSNATYYYYKERNHDNTAWVTLFRYTVATKIMEAVSNGVVLQDTAIEIHASTPKTTPIDADEIGIWDSISSTLQKLTWANLKDTLKNYFDTLYVSLIGNQTIAGVKTFSSSPIVPNATTATQAIAYGQAVKNTGNETKAGVLTLTDGLKLQGQNVSPFSGFKNYIINGKKVVNQRGLTSTDNNYNQDRWYKVGNNWYQGIEGDNNLISGKTYTLSWTGVATASYYVGTATSSTINAQSFTTIANDGNFTLTISAGQNLWIKFTSNSTGSTFNFVQLEEGSVATPFEQRPYGLELILCYRYFESSFSDNVVIGTDNLAVVQTGGFFMYGHGGFTIQFRTKKRTIPSLGIYSPLATPSENRVRRGEDGVLQSINSLMITQTAYVGVVNSGAIGYLYQLGWYASAEL